MAGPVVPITISYGNYTHPVGTATYTIQRNSNMDRRKRPVTENISIQISGKLHGTDTADLDAKFVALNNAYRTQDQDFVIKYGATSSILSIYASNTLGGIKTIQMPSLPDTMNGAHHSYLPFSIALYCVMPIVDPSTALISYQERLQFSGGGPKRVMIETLVGLPVEQIVRQHTIYKAVQSGSAVGMYLRPNINNPYWPSALTSANPDVDTSSANDVTGSIGMGYPVNWSYSFESETPLVGVPDDRIV